MRILLLGLVLLAGCSQQSDIKEAIAVVQPTAGNRCRGIVIFTQEEGGVRVVGNLEGLAPGKHGFHIHQWGNASSTDGKAMGGHFNPEHKDHNGTQHGHIGDLGNIVAGEDRIAHYNFLSTKIALGGKHSIIGRGLIIHRDEDDLRSQPTGNAGPRVGQAVIGIKN